jgi:hypothetical protein
VAQRERAAQDKRLIRRRRDRLGGHTRRRGVGRPSEEPEGCPRPSEHSHGREVRPPQTKILLGYSSQVMNAALLSRPSPRTAFECESSKGKAIICDVFNNSKEAKSVLITTHGAGGSHTAAAMTHWQEGSSQSLPSELKTLLPRRSAHLPCQ